MSDLFTTAGLEEDAPRPLADRLRPARIDDVVGQDHLLAADAPLGRMVSSGHLSSVIFWGPPGTGKTTVARLLAGLGGLHFEQISAIFSGVADLRKIFEAAKARRRTGLGTLLFVDEIHRFNRAQQDGFLPHMEDGTIVLVGATTENPSFELNGALLSRAQVLVLRRLDDQAMDVLLARAEEDTGKTLPLTDEGRDRLKAMADGDGRYLLGLAEALLSMKMDGPLGVEDLARVLQTRAPLYDKTQEAHYNLISALHKSVRGSDCDAALYYLGRMLDGGEDPLYIARRMIRLASEDVGLADPQALPLAIAARDAYEMLGSPEGELAIAQLVIYLATAPKSNAAHRAFKASRAAAKETGSLMPPEHILNAPTRLMKDLGYGRGYAYDHDTEDGFSGQDYFPGGLPRTRFYEPTERGFEREVGKRLAYWDRLREDKRAQDADKADRDRDAASGTAKT